MRLLLALTTMLVAGCFKVDIPNGALACSAAGKCPEGFHCASDGKCWKNGQNPMTTGDMAMRPVDMAQLPSTATHQGTVLSGGVTAKSENYKVIMSTGQPPGDNKNAASETVKKRSGLTGATQ